MPWWWVTLGNGARLLVMWGADRTLGGYGCSRTYRRSGRAHARIDNLPRRLVSFVGPSVSLFLAPLLSVGKILLTELLGANLFLFPLECRGSGGGSSGFLGSDVTMVVLIGLFPGLGALLLDALLFLVFPPFLISLSPLPQSEFLLRLFIARGGKVGVSGGPDARLGGSSQLGWIGCWFGQIGALVFPPFPIRFS
eukprot:scaffold8828_cov32-Attheya_sp.AAC.1